MTSVLKPGMFVMESFDQKAKRPIMPEVPGGEGLQSHLREGQMRANDTLHNASWYNKDGQKIGWGDLSIGDMRQIPGELPPGELFVTVYEQDSYWELPADIDPFNPGVKWLIEKASYVATKDGWFKLPDRYRPDYVPEEPLKLGSHRRFGIFDREPPSLIVPYILRNVLADIIKQVSGEG